MDQQDWIALDCAACGGRLRAQKSAIGTSVGCPSCGAAVRVKAPSVFGTPMIVDSSRKLGVAPEITDKDTEAFKSRLRSSNEDTYKVDPDNPVMKRRDNRKAKHGALMTGWDTTGRTPSQDAGRQQRRLVMALGVLTVVLLVIVMGILFTRSGSLAPPAPQASTATGPQREAAILEMQSAAEFRGKVWEVVTRFCSAETVDDLLPVVRDPARVGPLMREYYSNGRPWTPIPVGKVPDPSEFETDKNWTAFKLPLPEFRSRSMAVEETAHGFKVDWESFVAYSDISWKELREKRPKTPTLLRTIVRITEYYNLDYPSSDTHRCFQLTDEGRENVIYGYVKHGSAVEKQMQDLMMNSVDVHAVLRVAYPAKSTANNQVDIVEVIAKGWILRDTPPAPTTGILLSDPSEASSLDSAPAPSNAAPGRTPLPGIKGL